jgi:hypothetical protein
MIFFLQSTQQINKNQIKLVRPTEVHLSKLVAFQEAHEMTRENQVSPTPTEPDMTVTGSPTKSLHQTRIFTGQMLIWM